MHHELWSSTTMCEDLLLYERRYDIVYPRMKVLGIPLSRGDYKNFPERPISGYLTRQMSFLLNYFVYTEGEDEENTCIKIPRYLATGRTAPNGKVYPEVKIKNEDDLVPVRSIITKGGNEPGKVTPDLFSTNFKKVDITPGSAIGIAAGGNLTENITQGLLGLKHGGHEKLLQQEGIFKAPKKCTVRQDGKWLFLKVWGGEQKYPLPETWIPASNTKTTFEEGETIGTAYNTVTPAYRLNAIIKLLQAKGSPGIKYFEKENVITSDCYAYEDGIIKYTENKVGDIEVRIGNQQYSYNPRAMYYFPDGARVKKLQRFCSGVVNMNNVASDLGNDLDTIFNIFRRQFHTLNSKDYLSKGVVSSSDMQEEILELVFAGLIKEIKNPETGKLDEVDYLGTQKAILSRDSFFTTLSYGYSSRVMARAIRGELDIKNDLMTETVLGLLLNDKLDNNGNNRT